ncbi:MAG TPA: phenylacetate--CoA ligase family protein [Ktedonobacterales bacterium]
MRRRVIAGLLAAGALSGVGWRLGRRLGRDADVLRAGAAGPAALNARQRKRLRALIAFTRARSPYYRELYRNLPTDTTNLHALPVVTKPELMAHFDEWVTDTRVTKAGAEAFVATPNMLGERYLGRYVVWTTSGTTGKLGIFVHDPLAMSVYSALVALRAYRWMRPEQLCQGIVRWRLAVIAATGGQFAVADWFERLRRQLASMPAIKKRIRIYSVLMPLSELTRQLNDLQPDCLLGYPSAIGLLAGEQRAGRLHIAPTFVGFGGEGLAPGAHAQIIEAFNCMVRSQYGSSEFYSIAFECAHGWLHINSDWVILEPVDAAYQPTPPGQPSHTVLLTNLVNRVQPLIRYDLGDSITLKPDACSCGSSLPAMRVTGRQGDILRLADTFGLVVAILPLAIGAVVEETQGVRRTQIIQTGRDALRVRLEVADNEASSDAVWERVEQRLRDYLTTQGLPAVHIVRAPEPPQQSPTSGKFRQVWRDQPAAAISHSADSTS